MENKSKMPQIGEAVYGCFMARQIGMGIKDMEF